MYCKDLYFCFDYIDIGGTAREIYFFHINIIYIIVDFLVPQDF